MVYITFYIDNFDIRPRPALPSGPRASREVDDSAVPHQPPYIAYVSNLPYDIEEDDLRDLFADMQVLKNCFMAFCKL